MQEAGFRGLSSALPVGSWDSLAVQISPSLKAECVIFKEAGLSLSKLVLKTYHVGILP